MPAIHTQTPPRLPGSGAQVYDNLMRQIEPELTTDQLPLLADIYKNETREQAKERAVRYNRAYEAYATAYIHYLHNIQAEVASFRRTAFSSSEAKNAMRELSSLKALETLIAESI